MDHKSSSNASFLRGVGGLWEHILSIPNACVPLMHLSLKEGFKGVIRRVLSEWVAFLLIV